MLGIGLMLFSLRALDLLSEWKDGLVGFGFWATNVGLFAMVTFSLTGVIETLRWLRVFGDAIFAAGAVALAIFVIGLRTGGSTGRQRLHVGEPASVTGQS
jgi:nitric oxide reductase subunit B